jgi:hypothetical protein
VLRSLLFWLPDEAAVLVVSGIGIALITGIVNKQAAFRAVGLLCLYLALSPFIGALVDLIPAIWLVPIVVIAAVSTLRALIGVLIGQGATDHMVGSLAASAVRAVLVCFFLPVRLMFALLRWSLFGPRY